MPFLKKLHLQKRPEGQELIIELDNRRFEARLFTQQDDCLQLAKGLEHLAKQLRAEHEKMLLDMHKHEHHNTETLGHKWGRK